MPSTRGGAGQPQPKPPPPASTASSSSLSSGRQDRNVKSSNVPQSATPQSRSSEEMSEPPRRSQRSHQPKKEEAVKEDNEAEGDAAEEEEITRCVCGQQEYPGPPRSEAFNDADPQSEDAGGLFISCDGCSVWQHGGCVGILEDAQVPDNYYCEECKPKLHELHTDSKGQNYSLYQPVTAKTHRKGSMSKHGDKAQKERETTASRASADPSTGRRRATMRSKEHDDEEAAIQRAIEESRREVESNRNGRRNGKREREDGEDNKLDIKRARRASEAAKLTSNSAIVDDESEEEPATKIANKGKKAKADVVQMSRQAEQREKENEREKARAEAAGRRQERAGRRRVDEETSEETPKPSTSAKTSPPPSSQPASPERQAPPEKVSHKKGAGKKTKKLGNNQYTKNRDAASQGPTSSPPNGKKKTAVNNQSTSSGDEPMVNGDGSHTNNGNSTNKNSPERSTGVKGKFGKGKHKGVNGNGGKHGAEDPAELTLATMKRRIEAMASFVSKAQAELAGDSTLSNGGMPRLRMDSNASAPGVGGAVQPPVPRPTEQASDSADRGNFDNLTAMEMADVLTNSINTWRRRFGQGS